jgi:hypothetical protein
MTKLHCLVAILVGIVAQFAHGQDIDLTNRVATFTNLEGKLYSEVRLVRGDRDGVVWREGASGGRICYTNIHPRLLEAWGISTNRIEIAAMRAANKAAADAQFRALRLKSAQAELEVRRKQDLEWRAGEPARKREEQKQADLTAIQVLRQRLELAQDRVDTADAVTPVQAAGDPDFVNAVMAKRFQVNLAQVEVNRAKKQLDALEAEYDRKYGAATNSPHTGSK